jgi:hypothetical protein
VSTFKATTQPLKEPTAVRVAPTPAGSALVPAIDLLRVFSPGQWEDFALEWAHSLKSRYLRVERCGGAGDLGRDVVAFVSGDEWHNFQCKHYKEPLQPNQVVLELGKLCYYVHERAFSAPSAYYFVAPQGAGNSLSLLLKKAGGSPRTAHQGLGDKVRAAHHLHEEGPADRRAPGLCRGLRLQRSQLRPTDGSHRATCPDALACRSISRRSTATSASRSSRHRPRDVREPIHRSTSRGVL